jgi:hypothetical protein
VGYTDTGVKDSTEQKHFNAFANDALFRMTG